MVYKNYSNFISCFSPLRTIIVIQVLSLCVITQSMHFIIIVFMQVCSKTSTIRKELQANMFMLSFIITVWILLLGHFISSCGFKLLFIVISFQPEGLLPLVFSQSRANSNKQILSGFVYLEMTISPSFMREILAKYRILC